LIKQASSWTTNVVVALRRRTKKTGPGYSLGMAQWHNYCTEHLTVIITSASCSVNFITKITDGHRNRHVPIRHLWLLAFRGNYGPISCRLRDKRWFQSKVANGPVHFVHPRWRGAPVNWYQHLGRVAPSL